jgi:hypothetical protein
MFPDGLIVHLELEDSLPQFRSVSTFTAGRSTAPRVTWRQKILLGSLRWLTLIRISTLAPVSVHNTGHELEYD